MIVPSDAKYYPMAESFFPIYSDKKNANRLPSFYQLDFRIDRHFKFNHWKMNVYLDILNILNTNNISGYDYGENHEKIDKPDEESSISNIWYRG